MEDITQTTLPDPLQEILPMEYRYHLLQSEYNEDGVALTATFRIDVFTSEDAGMWLDAFEGSSKATWKCMRTVPPKQKKNLFKKIFRCQHGQQRKIKEGTSRHMKNTDCRSKMTVTVRKTIPGSGRKSRIADCRILEYPTEVRLEWIHNHVVSIPAALKFRKVSNETCKKLEDLFSNGHSPSSALNLLELELQTEDPEKYVLACGDRSICPDLPFCYRLYKKLFQKAYGAADGPGMLAALEDSINKYNNDAGMKCADISFVDGEPMMAIATPLMQRVHRTMAQSSELVFVDSTGNLDRHGSKVFLFLTHSSSGGLPLGVVITQNEKEGTLEKAFQQLQTLLPADAFGGRGERGPSVFITDDCLAERKALNAVFPNSVLLLCTFHVLQAVWRWLWDSKHGIKKDHRQSLFALVKAILYADDFSGVESAYDRAQNHPDVRRYPGFATHLETLYDRRQVWAQAFRLNLRIRGNNTNNYAEAAMRVLKESVMQRSKAFNIPQLLDFLLSRLEGFYQRKLLAVVNQRPLKWQPHLNKTTINKEDVSKTGENTYKVVSQTDSEVVYEVDMAVGVCACRQGRTGGACKHQQAVVKYFNITSDNYLPSSASQRKVLLHVATGSTSNVPSGWLGPLQSSEPTAEDVPEPDVDEPEPDVDKPMSSSHLDDHASIEDPQLVRLESLHAQRDLHNQFAQRMHRHYSTKYVANNSTER
ncbi:uncharacterized protein LOC756446 isoform X2 [Strongylocentrotus purpuratus]|uniref:SWIM-type domain-containing protein n=1 Tax=Strongylocentrotus purpuratus TaxID=7668 RepID=A0A7M7NNQ7_STRPU|nr:uncharacterized protein LOC756446 isoform X2 [Strongylocentrotus purpuratus]